MGLLQQHAHPNVQVLFTPGPADFAGAYTEAVAAAAAANQDFVMGFISQTPAGWPCAPTPPGEHIA